MAASFLLDKEPNLLLMLSSRACLEVEISASTFWMAFSSAFRIFDASSLDPVLDVSRAPTLPTKSSCEVFKSSSYEVIAFRFKPSGVVASN